MKIGIVGAGALGTFLGGILGKQNDVLILGKQDISLNEIKIVGKTNITTDVSYTTDTESVKDRDLIIICTKSYDTEEAVRGISPFLKENSMIMSLQNGLDNEKIISKYVDTNNIIGGITGIGVTFLKPGEVKHAGEGLTVVGKYIEKNDKRTYEIVHMLRNADLEVSISDDIYSHIWKKVIINSSINPITALTGVKNGALIESENLHELFNKVCFESTEVAKEEVVLPTDDMLGETEKVVRLTSENKSSMLQDIENKNKTEIECINGAIISVGKKVGIDTPYNETLFNLVKGKEEKYL